MKIHQMKLNNKPFNMIKNGRKNIELRLYDEKRRKLNIGDEIMVKVMGVDEKTGKISLSRKDAIYELEHKNNEEK